MKLILQKKLKQTITQGSYKHAFTFYWNIYMIYVWE